MEKNRLKNSRSFSLRGAAAEIVAELKSERLLPGFTSGMVVGGIEVIIAISFAALIFAGALSDFVPSGIGLALVGAIITGIVIALFTSLPGTVSGIQDAPAAILATVSAAIVAAMPAGANDLEVFFTVVAVIAITTISCGLFLSVRREL